MKTEAQTEGGYVFVLALVTIAVLALGMIGTANLVQANLLRTTAARDHYLAGLEALSERNRIIFALMKELDERSPGFDPTASLIPNLGRGEPSVLRTESLFSDRFVWDAELLGERLETPGGLFITVLDHSGLIDLNARNDNYLAHVADVLGVESPRSAVDSLRDFTDADSLKRASGAEQAGYPDSVRVPNAPLRTPEEICDVLYWRDSEICRNPLLRSMRVVAGEGHFVRFMTANADVRDLLLPRAGSDERSQQIVEWVRLSEALGFFDLALMGGQSGPRYTIIVEDERQVRFVRADVLVAPGDALRPFEILQYGYFPSASDAGITADRRDD